MEKANHRQGKKDSEGASPFKKGEVFSMEEKLEKKLQLRFRYWRGWMIRHLGLHKGVVFPSTDREYVNLLKKKVLSGNDPKQLFKLLDVDPSALKDPRITERVFLHRFKESIQLPQIGKTRGTTNPTKLNDTIEKDIDSFKELVDEYFFQNKKVQDIAKDPTDAKVWRHYIKPARIMLKAFGSNEHSVEGWEDVYRCFEVMASFVDHKHPYVCVYIPEKDPKILLLRGDKTIKDGLKIYYPLEY